MLGYGEISLGEKEYAVQIKKRLERSAINRLIRKQLTAYYLCPAFLAALISGKMILQVSEIFVRETGVPTMAGMYFAVSMALFFGIYLMYFLVTYIGFKRNVEGKQTVRGPGA